MRDLLRIAMSATLFALLGVAPAASHAGLIDEAGSTDVAGIVFGLLAPESAVLSHEATGDFKVYANDGNVNTFVVRDGFAMGGNDLNAWPYIEHSNPPNGRDIQGINFMIPDRSRFGWRFITRITETNLTTRATIDAAGNAYFMGSIRAAGLEVGTPGLYTPAALAWGNHLGGDFLSTLFSSSSVLVQGVSASVFGISYNGQPVFSQDAYGDVGIYGQATAKSFVAKSAVSTQTLQVGGSSITSGIGLPHGGCKIADIYLRRDATDGTTLYACTSPDVWTGIGTAGAKVSDAPDKAPAGSLQVQSTFGSAGIGDGTTDAPLATVSTTLGDSMGATRNWYVCVAIDATTAAPATTEAGAGRVTFAIGAPNGDPGGPGAAAPKGVTVLAEATGTAPSNGGIDGRYCNVYPSRARVSFAAYALASPGIRRDAVSATGRIDLRAVQQ